MPVLARLELETHAHHREADAPWLALLAPDVSRRRYGDQLARAFGLEQPLDAALHHTAVLSTLVPPRNRSRVLRRDLFALDYGSLDAIPRCWIAPFASVAEAAGWLYALERGSRIHAMVGGHVIDRLPQVSHAVTYLDDQDAPTRWAQLGVALDKIAFAPHIEEQIINAAHAAFRTITDWYASADATLRRSA